MKEKMKKKIMGWSAFYLCFILAGLLFTCATGNGATRTATAANQAEPDRTSKSKDTVAAVDADSSGMIYLQADENGTLTGDDAGAEIPVSVKVTYYLDGNEISAANLAGKSGAVKIRFDYQNLQQKTIQAGGEAISVSVPFMMLSAVVMPSDIFSNVKISSGKVMTEEDQNIAVGTAFPGLKTSLGLAEFDKTKDADIPDYVEITADAQNFELDFTANIIASLGMDEMDTDGLDDMDDLVESMDELADASSALVAGTGTLLSGMQTYQSAIASYTEGAGQLHNGISAINTAVAQFSTTEDDSYTAVMAAAKALAADTETLGNTMTDLQTFAQQLCVYQQNVETVKAAVAAEAANAQTSVEDADRNATSQAQVQTQNMLDEAKARIDSDETLTSEQKQAAIDALSSINASDITVSDVTGDADTNLSAIQSQLAGIPSLTIPTLDSDTAAIAATLTDMQTQLGILADFSKNMSGLGEGIATLTTSLRSLETGAAQLTSYHSQLLQGVGSLTEGMASLQEGMDTFDKEGIQKLKELAGDDLQKVVSRIKALKEAEAQYKKENAGTDDNAKSYVIETKAIL
ncbi:MAG: hypothetical protein PHW34_04240 [Hespellia sp.]|nr:hypothetical protein [Hespellia sp.]